MLLVISAMLCLILAIVSCVEEQDDDCSGLDCCGYAFVLALKYEFSSMDMLVCDNCHVLMSKMYVVGSLLCYIMMYIVNYLF